MKFTIAYTLLFFYVIAAIVFWGYSLNKQNKIIFKLEQENIQLKYERRDTSMESLAILKAKEKKIRRTKQFLGEGSTFILIILLSAGIVYYSYYRQQKLNSLQQNFMLSITHELKTPISGIKLNMQTLEKRKLDEDVQLKLIRSSVLETNRLNDLCNNILVATQLESTQKALFNEQVNLVDIISSEVNIMQSRYPMFTVQASVDVADFFIHGDQRLWHLVISNLLENARKYSGGQQQIEVELVRENGRTKLRVKDWGVGIAEEEKKRVFQKFYRIGNENTRTSKGTGLGLYIVKKIVTMYKYDISVKNNQPQGSIFEVDFKC